MYRGQPQNAIGKKSIGEPERRLDGDTLKQTLKIATACRAELEDLCIVHGIAYQGQPTTTLREALKQRMVQTGLTS